MKIHSAAAFIRPLVLATLVIAASLSARRLLAAQPEEGPSAALSVVLDGHSKGRIFDGIGAVSAGASSRLLYDYPEPQRSQILDYLFKPHYGASLQRLKIEIGADVNSTDGSEPSFMRTPTDDDITRGYEGWLIEEAHKRNPHIVFEVLPWGAPAWVSPKQVSGGQSGEETTSKPTLYTRQMAVYVADFIQQMEQHYHVTIAYAGLWNEKVYDLSYLHELYRQLALQHLATRIVCCDEYPSEDQWAIAREILKDPRVAQEVSAIGVHYPRENNLPTTTDAARMTGKPLWSSEDQPNQGGGPFVSREWAIGGKRLAQIYNDNYLRGSMTATEIWSPVTSYYDILAAPHSGLMYANTPWSGAYRVQSTIWVTAHTTQFAQPGWQYLDQSSKWLPSIGSFVTLASPDRSQWSFVLETIGAKRPLTLNFRLTGGLHASTVHLWLTDAQHRFAHIQDLPVTDSEFHYTFLPDSLYTLTNTSGQQRGTAVSPKSAPFPMPYFDDFEHTPLHRAARYLADQDGAFQATPCIARPGRCLEQVITQLPITWGPAPDPFTIAGDASAQDYTLSVDLRIISHAPATLLARIDSADVFKDHKAEFPSGYILRIAPRGNWELLSTAFRSPTRTLASGSIAFDATAWHHLTLQMRGPSITATCDSQTLATVRDTSHTHGMFGIGSGWNRVQFDNLRVTPMTTSR